MNRPQQASIPRPRMGAGPPVTSPPTISSTELLAGTREVLIRHGAETYRLKLTNSNKLILTK